MLESCRLERCLGLVMVSGMAVERVRAWVPVSVFGGGLAYLFFGVFQPLRPFDEGLVLVGAERILHGAVPYRDFAAYYTPGQFYTLAAIFHAFGSSVLVERVWDTLVRFGICVLVFLIARRLAPGRAAYPPFFITLLFLGWCGFYGYPVIPAMFCALMAIFLLLRDWPENRSWCLLLAGLAAGFSAFYRQDVGAYAIASGAIALLIAGAGARQDSTSARVTTINRLMPLVWYGLGTCLVAVPLVVYFVSKVPASELWADFMKLPRLQIQFRSVPLPPVIPSRTLLFSSIALDETWFLFYVPVAILAITWANLARRTLRRATGPKADGQHFAEVLLTLFGSLLLVTTVTRADPIHCLAPTIPAAILLVPLLQEWPRWQTWGAPSLAVCLVVLAVPYGASPVVRWGLNLRACPPWGPASSLPRARLFRVPADQEAAIRFIQAHVPESQAIFVGNTQQRRVYANDALFYFLADRQPGTRYEEFEPGVVTVASVQREMVRELQGNHVDWVVLFSGFESSVRKMSSAEEGSDVLDHFLRRGYEEVEKFGRYSVLEKDEGSNHANAQTAPTCSGANPSTPWARAPDALPCRSSVYQLAAFSSLHAS